MLPPNVTLLRSGLNVDIRPPRPPTLDQGCLDYDRFHPVVTGAKPLNLPEHVVQAFADAKEAVAKLEVTPGQASDDVVVVPLGTSSALPSKYRNGTF